MVIDPRLEQIHTLFERAEPFIGGDEAIANLDPKLTEAFSSASMCEDIAAAEDGT